LRGEYLVDRQSAGEPTQVRGDGTELTRDGNWMAFDVHSEPWAHHAMENTPEDKPITPIRGCSRTLNRARVSRESTCISQL
jgi:hypothetical protein